MLAQPIRRNEPDINYGQASKSNTQEFPYLTLNELATPNKTCRLDSGYFSESPTETSPEQERRRIHGFLGDCAAEEVVKPGHLPSSNVKGTTTSTSNELQATASVYYCGNQPEISQEESPQQKNRKIPDLNGSQDDDVTQPQPGERRHTWHSICAPPVNYEQAKKSNTQEFPYLTLNELATPNKTCRFDPGYFSESPTETSPEQKRRKILDNRYTSMGSLGDCAAIEVKPGHLPSSNVKGMTTSTSYELLATASVYYCGNQPESSQEESPQQKNRKIQNLYGNQDDQLASEQRQLERNLMLNGSPPLLSASPISAKMSEAEHGSTNGLSSPCTSTSSYPTDRKHYIHERDRLNTFHNWPVTFLKGEEMAAAGFYYLKRDDVVRCAFCGVEVGNWVLGDDPREDHKKWAPKCHFITGLPTDNVPISSECSGVTSDAVPMGYDTCGTRDYRLIPPVRLSTLNGNPIDETSRKLGVIKITCPQHPEYATIDKRLRSFGNWPISMQIKPDVLSTAGFFYTGIGDQTKCFQCGGGLKDWESNDDPFVEHAKWFPKCPFIINCKGKSFVDSVVSEAYPKELQKSPSDSALEERRKATGSPDSLNSSGSSGVHSRTSSFSDDNPIPDSKLCKICYKNEMGIVFLPCGHILACFECAPSLGNCAVCRKPVEATVRAFLS